MVWFGHLSLKVVFYLENDRDYVGSIVIFAIQSNHLCLQTIIELSSLNHVRTAQTFSQVSVGAGCRM